MVERGFLAAFSEAAVAEVERVPGAARPGPGQTHDLRSLLWASIDNDDSRDLDQLSVSEPMNGDGMKILVAVADVDALVAEGSAINEHARHNTTSVYTAGGIFPMLPERLSTDLTSLGENDERLAVVVEMVVQADGALGASAIYRALVRNHAKLAYNAVAAWLDGRAPAPAAVTAVRGLDEQLRVQERAAQALRRRRHERGALELQTIQARAVFDGDVLADLRPDEPNRAKALIEDFMIAANGVTARYLEAQRLPSLRRVLRTPKRWDRIVELAAGLGERLPDAPDAAALGTFLARRHQADPERFPDLSLSVVKLMGSGEYVVDTAGGGAGGHFGLAVRDYTHSTAPNRRFPDLITQRLLKAALAQQPSPYGPDELAALARHCTQKEDDADKVERQVRKSAAALLLEPRIGQRFDGLVTGASEKGTWVRIVHPPVEGKVVRGEHGLDVGDHVRVQLVATDVEHGYIDFGRVSS